MFLFSRQFQTIGSHKLVLAILPSGITAELPNFKKGLASNKEFTVSTNIDSLTSVLTLLFLPQTLSGSSWHVWIELSQCQEKGGNLPENDY